MGKTFSDVILVVKEPIDPNSLPSKYCKLKKMLSTKTYLEWPQQDKQQAFFWEQLRSVLGKPVQTRERLHSAKSRTSSVGAVSVIELPVEDGRPATRQAKVDGGKQLRKEDVERNEDEMTDLRPIPVAVA